MAETTLIDTAKLASDIMNAAAGHLIRGSQTLVNYQNLHAKLLADFTAYVADLIDKKQITGEFACILLRDQETIQSVYILAVDVIKDSTKAKVIMDVLKVVQTAVNKATGLSLALF